MKANNTPLEKRLEKLWQEPDFNSFFEKFSKRSPIKIGAGNIVFYEGDTPGKLYFIKSGFVKLYQMSPEGRSTIIYLVGPNTMIGLRALTNQDKKLKHTAEAITDTEVITISESDYINALSENPEYIIDLLSLFIDRLNHTERKLEGFILSDTTAHIASFLYDTVIRFSEVKNNKTVIPLPLTHQTISEFVGAFRETVTIAMNRLKKDGVLEDKRGKITITNVNKLKQQALI